MACCLITLRGKFRLYVIFIKEVTHPCDICFIRWCLESTQGRWNKLLYTRQHERRYEWQSTCYCHRRPYEIQREPWKFPPEPPGPVSCAPLHYMVRLNPSTSMYSSDYVKVTVQWRARDDADGTSVLFLILCYVWIHLAQVVFVNFPSWSVYIFLVSATHRNWQIPLHCQQATVDFTDIL